MSVTIADFWNLLLASRLASPNSLPTLQAKFSQLKGAEDEGNASTLAQWLVSQGVLSLYQAKVLLAGQPGPFVYGDYRVFERLASGRLQGAFRALHPATRHRVLLWFHSGAIVQNQQWWSVAANQIALAAQVVHPHIARIYQLCDLGQFKFTALEDLHGTSADTLLAQGSIPWAVACRMIRQAAMGLSRMHELQQLHGSIRPQNLWINNEKNVKLLLPPVARDPRIVPGSIDLSAANAGEEVSRQADYLAPEMAQTGQLPNITTDVYALGCTLFHLLAGKPPFAGRDVLSKLASHGSEKIPSLETVGIPAPIDQLLAGMMAKEPLRRFQKVRQVVETLTDVLKKLESAQLHWPASAVSNKLPEYEAWLQPYKLAPESKTNWVPEIETPPILAASMRVEEKKPGFDFFPELSPPGLPVSSIPGAFNGISLAPQSSAPTIPSAAKPSVALTHNTLSVRQQSVGLPEKDHATNAVQYMTFPPDESAAIIPFTAVNKKQQKHSQHRMIFSGAAVATIMVILLLIWLSMNQKHQQRVSTSGTNNNSASIGKATADNNQANVETTSTESKANDKHDLPPKQSSDSKSSTIKTDDEPKDAIPGNKSGDIELRKRHKIGIEPNEKTNRKLSKQDNQQGLTQEENPIISTEKSTLAANFETDTDSDEKSQRPTNANDLNNSVGELLAADNAHTADYANAVLPTVAEESQAIGHNPQIVPLNGQGMWESPTHGLPIIPSYLAPGVQAVLLLRPADIFHIREGTEILAALGPMGEEAKKTLETLCGTTLTEIDQLTIGWISQFGSESHVLPMYIFRFTKPANQEKILAQWGYGARLKNADWAMYQIPQGLTAVFPPNQEGKVLVLGTTEAIQDVIKLAGQPPVLPRPIEKLLRTTDDQQLATLLWMPNVAVPILNEISSANPWQILTSSTEQFFGTETRAAMLSAHLTESSLFLELRVQGGLERPPDTVSRQFKDDVAHLANALQSWSKKLKFDAYDEPLVNRFPQMLKLLDEFTRAGFTNNQVILRCYLPSTAAQNLLMGAELALAERTTAPENDLVVRNGQTTQAPQHLAEKLKRITTLSFARDTLEKAIQMLADDLGIKAEIIGPDLQLEGITKNQSFGLDEKDKPADEILRIIMLKANPDGKLVYVVKPSASGTEETLWITTRQAAAKRGDVLPPELEKLSSKK